MTAQDQNRRAVLGRLATFTDRVEWIGAGAELAFADSVLELVSYLSPEDVDEIAVERACRGERNVRLNSAETLVTFRWLDAHGYSSRQIADRLGVTQRTVTRWRSGVIQRPLRRGGAA